MITIHKNKYYYFADDDGAFALSALTGIRIKRKRWHINAEYIDNVILMLDSYNLPYCIIRDGELVISKTGSEANENAMITLGAKIDKLQKYIRSENSRIRRKLNNSNSL